MNAYSAIALELVISMITSVVFYVLLVVANWKIFTKAGEKGWKSIIPFYNQYVLFKLTWKPLFFFIELALSVVGGILYRLAYMENAPFVILLILAIVCMVAALVIQIMQLNKLAKSFNHSAGFTVGLVLLPNIFTLILAFNKDTYTKIN